MASFYFVVAAAIVVLVTMRNAVIAGGVYLYSYVWKREQLRPLKFNPEYPKAATIWHEIKLDTINTIHFVIYDTLIVYLYMHGYTRIYSGLYTYPVWYLPLSFFLLLVIHDAYFYWTHRLMHLRRFAWMGHSLHHRFYNPSPWAAFAMHPIEGNVNVLFHLIIVFVLPLHVGVIAAYLAYSFLSNVLGHAGYKIGSTDSKLSGNPHYHYLHHRHGKGYYSLYFVWWDRLMKTTI